MNAHDHSDRIAGIDTSGGQPGQRYEITVRGHLAPRWSTWFDGFDLLRNSDGTTVISGSIVDQAALHGLLERLRDLGIPLISLTPITPSDTSQPERP